MAWIQKRKRANGGVSATVVWRDGGKREGAYQSETFAAGTDAQNLARADGFRKLVDSSGQDSAGPRAGSRARALSDRAACRTR